MKPGPLVGHSVNTGIAVRNIAEKVFWPVREYMHTTETHRTSPPIYLPSRKRSI